jgi:hypothetical protein
MDLTASIIEARWSTDSHTLGDGTFRGDLQPGRLTLRLWDPKQRLLGVSKLGTIWGTYNPTGATWCFFLDSITVQLAPPGAPVLNEMVVTADAWPDRLTVSSYQSGRPAETVAARVNAIVARLGSDTGLVLPAVTGTVEADTHTVPAVVSVAGQSTSVFPSFLQQLRDAASNGLLWLEAVPGAGAGLPGSLIVHYMLVETVAARPLTNDQVVAASIWEQSLAQLLTEVTWAGVNASGVATRYDTVAGGWGAYGLHQVTLRVWGDVTAGGAQRAATDTMAAEILKVRGAPDAVYVDTIDMVSGDRTHPNGSPGPAWDATLMVWPPHGVAQWFRVTTSPQESYRVASSAHVLNSRGWTVTHTLEKFVQPTHIP